MATSSKYQFDDLTVEKCFSNFFVVPDYQREYVWEAEKQVEQLLTDIEEAYSNDAQKEYFIGTTVVFNNNGSNELIDGQQRTTTLFLTLCAFKSVFAQYGFNHQTIDQCIANTTADEEVTTCINIIFCSSTRKLHKYWSRSQPTIFRQRIR